MGDEVVAYGDRLARSGPLRFPDISSRAYEHPADQTALVALRKLPGLDIALRKLQGMFSQRALRMEHLASTVRTSDRQFGGLHEMLRDAAAILDLDRVPEMFVRRDPYVNAMTIGMNEPFVVLTTGLVDTMDPDELRFVIGHELGHAMSGHSVYRTIATLLVQLGAMAASVPLGGLTMSAVQAALDEWMRKSELSCDRAGLLVTQDRDACLRALMKLAGGAHLAEMNVAEFLAQAAEFDQAGDVRDTVIRYLLTRDQSHPLLVVRVAELNRWALGDDYENILCGIYPLRTEDADASLTQSGRDTVLGYAAKGRDGARPLLNSARELGTSVTDRSRRAIAPMRRKAIED